MRESPSPRQYKDFLFIETSLLFNRYDIIDRIVSSHKYLKNTGRIGVIFYSIGHKKYQLLISNRTGEVETTTGNIRDLIYSFINTCSKPVILDEHGKYRPDLVVEAKCLIAGLHSDLPGFIGSLQLMERVKLSGVSYLASQLLYIIDNYPFHQLP